MSRPRARLRPKTARHTAQHGASWASPHSEGCVSGGYAAARVQRCVEDPRTSLWRQRSPAQCQHVAHAAFP